MLSFILFLVVYRTIPTSNHNLLCRLLHLLVLYIVLFLHQTTTLSGCRLLLCCCISYYSYIKPQLADGQMTLKESCISYYSYIKPQLSVSLEVFRAVVYRTIPTSNHNRLHNSHPPASLYIVLFLHQTTTEDADGTKHMGCISYYSYIKPQLICYFLYCQGVVYRTIPTSNHNAFWAMDSWWTVVYRTIPTSNHNSLSERNRKPPVVYRTIPTSNHNWIPRRD